MKDYSNFTENDVVDIRGLSIEQIKYILDLNPKNECHVKAVKKYNYYRPLGSNNIGSYDNYYNEHSFTIHPASDFLPQIKPTFKRGDLIKVWDDDENKSAERIGLVFIEGSKEPVVCVSKYNEEKFKNNEPFVTTYWKHWRPITENPRKQEIMQQIEVLKKELETIKD